MTAYTISDQFVGGNITVAAADSEHVKLQVDYRDSEPWFYWAFKVSGAAGRTLTFSFDSDRLGYFGPAVSYDLQEWHWAQPDRPRLSPQERQEFTYTFSGDENEVYFAHNMLYSPEAFEKLDFVKKSTLCTDSDGSSVPLVQMGEGEKVILLTARHHACEAPANYVLEGVLKAFARQMPEGYRVLAVPFVDLAGVLAGDQGKGRMPHDHNRDYHETSIYPTVRAIKELLAAENVRYVFDFHSPLHIGGWDDHIRLVNAYADMRPDMERLSELYKEEITSDCFDFREDMTIWREQPQAGTFSAYSGALEKVAFVATLEVSYFGEPKCPMSRENYLANGEALGRAITRFVEMQRMLPGAC